ncbi:AMIN domain-containing protein [Pseudanabaena sp. FACHB-1277]|uniref:AMIN domain-containing protein n=1 Tax=Pseudanabaena cinerea FACHB-1277 TaxID=2949581 RepID=A0A926USD0_9CYAN|nr:secretin N-terminal domain-containing protein [Pseudanabaena cinerea]MBD2150197.1 AMIN domain-containing protein [Pseudanabaena cinerea FACHB-1277]
MNMNTNLNFGLNFGLRSKSLACWFLIAASCPHVLMLSPANAQTAVSANPPSPADVLGVASRITDIDANVSGDRLNLVLNFASSDRPQVTYTRQGKAWIALLNGAQLQLNNGNASYAKANPVPGVTAIEATQYAANRVRIRVTANDPEMFKDLFKRQDSGDRLTFSLEMQPSATQSNTISAANLPEAGVINGNNAADPNRTVVAQNTAVNSSVGQPLFKPQVSVTGTDGKTRVAQTNAPQANTPQTVPPPVNNPVSPQLPGRVPGVVPPFRQIKTPPVGDIATTTARLRADIVELGTAERVPSFRFVARAIDVLSALGRIVDLNVVSLDTGEPATPSPPPTDEDVCLKPRLDRKVDIDIKNEPVQDIFNNVLRITCLEANRIGNTIFVGTRLPVTLKNLVTKSYRLNQITTGEASAYLIGLGASRVVSRQRPIPGVQTATLGTAAQAIINVTTEAVPTLETISIPAESGSSPLLKGLQVIAEERSNSLTLIGSPRQVEFAEAQLARLDLRKRQVNVNVRVVEVNLSGGQTVAGGVNFIGGNPSISGTNNQSIGIRFDSGQSVTLPRQLIASIIASINAGNAKILTDPSLTVQEGETATVALTQDISTGTRTTTTSSNNITTTVIEPTKAQAGLTLSIQIDRVDDNGFVNLSISPIVSAPVGSVTAPGGTPLTLLSNRILNSGKIRLRDGQTFILSGVIQDSDIESVSKVPFFGDLPIIGALFRSSSSQNNRSEVVIIVTPRIIDDSQNATWGYTYQPGPETQRILDSNKIKPQ